MPISDLVLYMFIFIGSIHLGYGLYFLVGLSNETPATENNEAVSVIVAARNEKDNLQKLIPSLFSQEYADFEVVIALNGTSDGSLEMLTDFQEKYKNLKIINIQSVPPHIHPKKFALNSAIEVSKNDIILLTDADCIPTSERWISKMANRFSGTDQIVLGYSPYISGKGLIHYFTQFDTMLTAIQYISSAQNGHPYMGVGRNMAYRKSFYMENGGFGKFEHVIGGDDDLFVNQNASKLNTKVQWDPASFVYTKPELTFKGYFQQKLRHISVGRHYRLKSKIFLGLFSLTHSSLFVVAIASIFLTINLTFIFLIFILAYLPFLISFSVFRQKTNNNFPLALVILIDVVFTFFYIFVGIQAMFTKRIEWTN